MSAIILKNESREEWLSQRNKGIGGTDISAILGVNKWKTPYQLWEDKTGRAPKFEGNKMTKRGQYMEDAVANYFADVSGHQIIKASETDEILLHSKYPFLLGSPDRRYFDAEGGKGILECKTTMSSLEADLEAIPQAWFIQLQWYMGLIGYKRGTIAWAELGFSSEFKHLEIDFNHDFFAYMVEQGVIFWNEYVVKDIAPAATNSADIERIYSSHAERKYITASEDFAKIYDDLKALKLSKKDIDGDIEAKEEALKLALGDAEGAKYGESILCTWKSAKGSVKFDDKAFKEVDPLTWAKYVKETAGSRRFLLK